MWGQKYNKKLKIINLLLHLLLFSQKYVDSKSLKNELPPQFVHFFKELPFRLRRKSGNIAKKSS